MRNIVPIKQEKRTEVISIVILHAKKHNCSDNPIGEYLLDKQIKTIKEVFPLSDISVVVGYKADKLYSKNVDCRFIENTQHETYGVSKSLELYIRAVKPSRFIVCHGDIVFDNKSINNILTKESSILIDNNNQVDVEKVGVLLEGDYVDSLTYKVNPKWAQLVYFSENECKILSEFLKTSEYRNLFLFELINKVIEYGGKFKTSEANKLIEINNRRDIERFKKCQN